MSRLARWRAALGAYRTFFALGFAELSAYRVTVVMLLVSLPITLGARYFILKTLYQGDTTRVGAYDLPELLTYIALTFVLRGFFRTNTDRHIGHDIRSGDIVFDLLRPLDFLHLNFARALGRAANRLLLVSLPLLAAILIGQWLVWPPDLLSALGFVAATGLGFCLGFLCEFLVGVAAMFWGYNVGLIWTFDMLVQVLAGLLLPLSFYPEAVARVFMALPFHYIYYTPTEFYFGRLSPADQLSTLGGAFAWLLLLWIAARLLLRFARRHISVAGG